MTSSFTNLMDYESNLFLEVMSEDGLLITAEGLGLDRLLLKTFNMFCSEENLVLVLNTTSEEQDFFINELSVAEVKHLPQVITAENLSSERRNMYFKGGVFFVTSRILVVDMLTKRLPIDYVTGIIVQRAHKTGISSQESFILRLFRENNSAGFIKGFSDRPTAFMSGFAQVERIMKQLFVRKLYLRPRFHSDVVEYLDRHKPEVIELSVELTPLMSGVQMSLLDLIETCLRELKKSAPSLDPEEITLENSLTRSFDKLLKYELDPHWNQLSNRTKQLISDIRILRVILSYLTQYDCVTFYNFLNSLRTSVSESAKNNESLWMLMDAADNLFINAKARVCGNSKLSLKTSKTYADGQIEASPKWQAVKEILEEIDEERNKSEISENAKVLICVSDERTCYQLRQVLCEGGDVLLNRLYEKSCLYTTADSASSLKKRKLNKDEEEEEKETEDIDIQEFNIESIPNAVIVIHPLYGCSDPYSLLRKLYEMQPTYVLLYDTAMQFVRQLEVYKASRPGTSLRVYFIMYNGSIEEQRFLTMLRKEKNAFENLIRQKAEMVIPEERQGKTEIARSMIRDSSKANESVNTRRAGGQVKLNDKNKSIIVDMREFRSELPSLIHKRGIDIDPVTLEVGDYILSPRMCVERKSLSDLIGSLNNGRLYTQCVAMTRFYERPVLLIEFDESKSFSLQSKQSIKSEVSIQNISSKLTLLTIHFPKLRIIWSQSPYLTAEIFESLKQNNEEPDAQVAMAIGVDQSESSKDILFSIESVDIVKKLAGITEKNYKKIVNKYRNLKELVNQSEDELCKTLENASLGKQLFEFINKKYEPTIETTDTKKRKR